MCLCLILSYSINSREIRIDSRHIPHERYVEQFLELEQRYEIS